MKRANNFGYDYSRSAANYIFVFATLVYSVDRTCRANARI